MASKSESKRNLILNQIPNYTGSDMREVRKKLGLKVDDLANMLGLSSSTIWRYEVKKADEELSIEYKTFVHFLKNCIKPYLVYDNPNFQEKTPETVQNTYQAQGERSRYDEVTEFLNQL